MSLSEKPPEDEEHAREKQQAAARAVTYVTSGMVVGLGAGTTAVLATPADRTVVARGAAARHRRLSVLERHRGRHRRRSGVNFGVQWPLFLGDRWLWFPNILIR